MEIEVGKYYRTRDGSKVGPIGYNPNITNYGKFFSGEISWDEFGRLYQATKETDYDLIAEWAEDNDLNAICDERQDGPFVSASGSPKTWGKMSDDEQGALLLAKHRGKDIQYWCEYNNDWLFVLPRFVWFPDVAYRVQPKPMRKTVALYADFGGIKSMCDIKPIGTIDLEDGKPVADSIKMEEV